MAANEDVNDETFISMMCVWVHKSATYPLELITFLEAANGEKVIAIPDYGDSDKYLYLGERSYKNYQTGLAKVGALMDKMNYPLALNIYKQSHPLSCVAFCKGYDSDNDINPFTDELEQTEWEAGRNFKFSKQPSE